MAYKPGQCNDLLEEVRVEGEEKADKGTEAGPWGLHSACPETTFRRELVVETAGFHTTLGTSAMMLVLS